MLRIEIPGFKALIAEHLVLDFNGTLAVDGYFIEGVVEKLVRLSSVLKVHILRSLIAPMLSVIVLPMHCDY